MTTKNNTVSKKSDKQTVSVTKGENKKNIPAPVTGKRGRKPMSEEEKAVAREKRAQNIAAFRDAAISAMAQELGLETLPQKFIDKHVDEINAEALKLYRASKPGKKTGKRNLYSIAYAFIAKRWRANMKKKTPISLETFKRFITKAINVFDPEFLKDDNSVPVMTETTEETGKETATETSTDELEEIEA